MNAPAADTYLAERIRTALVQDARVSELGVHVVVVGGRAVVTGTVATAGRKAAIADVVHEQFPDVVLQNDVSVPEIGRRPPRETIE